MVPMAQESVMSFISYNWYRSTDLSTLSLYSDIVEIVNHPDPGLHSLELRHVQFTVEGQRRISGNDSHWDERLEVERGLTFHNSSFP